MPIYPTSKDPYGGPEEEENMARIYALLGDADHAIPILKRLLQIPAGLVITPALLRLDPVWDQIRNDPRFEKLAAAPRQRRLTNNATQSASAIFSPRDLVVHQLKPAAQTPSNPKARTKNRLPLDH